jgi:hypothetical protein
MTPEAQRIAIAEACGWCDINPNQWSGYHKEYAPLRFPSDEREGWFFGYIPDYLSNLNAMHEAENVLTDEQMDEFHVHLLGEEWDENDPYMMLRFASRATAAQRAEAFLRTIGKWVEEKKSK